MSLKIKQFFSIFALLLTVWAGFHLSVMPAGEIKMNEAQAINVWGDWFDRTVGQKGFDDIGFGRRDPRAIIASVVNILFGLLGVLAILLIMYGGFVWMTAGGDSDKIEQAKDILRNATIGLLIILSSFALAIYVLSRLIFATSGIKNDFGDGSGDGGALGALGAGIVKSVYPAPEQQDVPRNTIIIITFREAIDPASMCSVVDGEYCGADAELNAENIQIYKTDQGAAPATDVSSVKVISEDNKTFVFYPEAYLGSPSEKIWYTVALGAGVKKANGSAAFSLGGFEWRFEVSNKLDLTPPQVVEAGVFPLPDNGQDTVGETIDAIQAKGSIEVKRAPQVYVANSVSYIKTNPASAEIDVDDQADNICDGELEISINATAPLSANLAYRNMVGKVDVPQAAIIDREIITACGFKVVLDPGFAAGHSWSLTLKRQRQADSLLVGSSRYVFVDAVSQAGEILVDNDLNVLANNIKNALQSNAAVTAETIGTRVLLTAKVAGRSGNNIAIDSSADYAALGLWPMQGGADQAVIMNKVDKSDKPKNSIIQINFNEPINPLNVSGPSVAVASFIKVVNLADNSVVEGEFLVSNQYQTVEFQPSAECGLNACGDKVYCLPPNSQLAVELSAATLSAACTNDDDCLTRTPYNICQGGVCADGQNGAKYPQGQADTGIMDMASNSLDGNRDGLAAGPLSFYNENVNNVTEGDSYRWSFWISDQLDLTAPRILQTAAAQGEENVDLLNQVFIHFNKLMMAASLTSGSVIVDNGQSQVTHKLINLWSKSQEPLGYWVEKNNKDTSEPLDNEPDQTIALISHSRFSPSTVYRAQVGSGVKDIYQNCYKPCAGPGCDTVQNGDSCCNGVSTAIGNNGQCP